MKKQDMYDKQNIVGTKMEKILNERRITKTKVCNETGISKPTLDKLLNGTLTSRANYSKHISKLLRYLDITEEELIGSPNIAVNQISMIRNVIGKTQEEVADMTGIPLERYIKIEDGEEASLRELRDIAAVLYTSVNDLLGKNYFLTQISVPELFLNQDHPVRISGFWGHIGILPMNSNECLWYPITRNVRNAVYKTMNQHWVIIPCMNNRLLVINSDNIKDILFSDDACDEPTVVNWDNSVDCGQIPLVYYEAFLDYYYDDFDANDMSDKFIEAMKILVEKKNKDVDIDSFAYSIMETYIYYADGYSQSANLDLVVNDELAFMIKEIFEFEDCYDVERYIPCEEEDGTEILINTKNISMIDVPLLDAENAINVVYEELMRDMESI